MAVASLPPLARALLSDDLGGREEVPQHVARRVTADAASWSAYGFASPEVVRAWSDLPPEAAAYLVERGVPPRVLELPTQVARAAVPLRLAIATGVLPVERAYELLVATGEHQPEAASPSPDPEIGPTTGVPVGATTGGGAGIAGPEGPAGDAVTAGKATPGARGRSARKTADAPVPAWSGPREEEAPRPAANRPVAPVVFSHAAGRRPQSIDG